MERNTLSMSEQILEEILHHRDNFFAPDIQQRWFGDEESLRKFLDVYFLRGETGSSNFLSHMGQLFNNIGQINRQIQQPAPPGAAVGDEAATVDEAPAITEGIQEPLQVEEEAVTEEAIQEALDEEAAAIEKIVRKAAREFPVLIAYGKTSKKERRGEFDW